MKFSPVEVNSPTKKTSTTNTKLLNFFMVQLNENTLKKFFMMRLNENHAHLLNVETCAFNHSFVHIVRDVFDACEASALDHSLFVGIVRDIRICLCLMMLVWIPSSPHKPVF